MKKTYFVVRHYACEELEKSVNIFLNSHIRYELVGGVSYNTEMKSYMQAMVRYEQ